MTLSKKTTPRIDFEEIFLAPKQRCKNPVLNKTIMILTDELATGKCGGEMTGERHHRNRHYVAAPYRQLL